MRNASSSSSGSSSPALADLSEKERFLTAILPLASSQREAEQLTDLLLSLSKKDRAMCLFNSQHLAAKVQDARTVLSAVESPLPSANSVYPTPRPTPESRFNSKFGGVDTVYTLTTLAALPASKIINLVHSDSPPVVAAAPDPEVVLETDRFIDSLEGKAEHERKQKLGEKLFKVVKALGFKNSVSQSLCYTARLRP